MNKWALIDASYLAHRARFSARAYGQSSVESILFSFFQNLLSVCKDHRVSTNQALICLDSELGSLRQQSYPEYKNNRSKRKLEQWEVRELERMKDALCAITMQLFGFPYVQQRGLESDDLMAQAALQADRSVLVTSDSDLLQCISHKTDWFDPSRNLYLDEAGLFEQNRVSPRDWIEVKCMAGCRTDNILGIPGVGEKTATDYLWKILPPTHKRFKLIESEAGLEIIERNRKLVTLPHPKTKEVSLTAPSYQTDKFFSTMEKWSEPTKAKDEWRVSKRSWNDFFAGRLSGESRQMARMID